MTARELRLRGRIDALQAERDQLRDDLESVRACLRRALEAKSRYRRQASMWRLRTMRVVCRSCKSEKNAREYLLRKARLSAAAFEGSCVEAGTKNPGRPAPTGPSGNGHASASTGRGATDPQRLGARLHKSQEAQAHIRGERPGLETKGRYTK